MLLTWPAWNGARLIPAVQLCHPVLCSQQDVDAASATDYTVPSRLLPSRLPRLVCQRDSKDRRPPINITKHRASFDRRVRTDDQLNMTCQHCRIESQD